ncbi:Hypothetical predicted protein, partial [Paramuricea clavata]
KSTKALCLCEDAIGSKVKADRLKDREPTNLPRTTSPENGPSKNIEKLLPISNLKQALAGRNDPRKETEIVADASSIGFGGSLMQDRTKSYLLRKPQVESTYSQTDREMLAVVSGAAEHFHFTFTVQNFTSSPTTSLLKSNKHTSTQIDRRKLIVMPNDCELHYRPGRNEENPLDFTIRQPNVSDSQIPDLEEEDINYAWFNAVPKESGHMLTMEAQNYAKLKEELAVNHKKTILIGNCLTGYATDDATYAEKQNRTHWAPRLRENQDTIMRQILVPWPSQTH